MIDKGSFASKLCCYVSLLPIIPGHAGKHQYSVCQPSSRQGERESPTWSPSQLTCFPTSGEAQCIPQSHYSTIAYRVAHAPQLPVTIVPARAPQFPVTIVPACASQLSVTTMPVNQCMPVNATQNFPVATMPARTPQLLVTTVPSTAHQLPQFSMSSTQQLPQPT